MHSAPTDFPLLSDREVVEAITQELERQGRVEVKLWGRSMLPWVWPGTRLAVDRCRAEDLRLGDLVLLRNGSTLALHRVIRVYPDLQTQGDAFPDPDDGGEVIGFVPTFVMGRRAFRIPLPALRLINRGALSSTRVYRHLEPGLRSTLKRAWETSLRLPGVRPARACLLPWQVEVLTAAYLPELRRYLLLRGMRPTNAVLAGWHHASRPGSPFAIVAVSRGRIVGSARVAADDNGATYLVDLFVTRAYRNLGVACALVRECIAEAAQRGIPQLYTNVRAERGSAWAAMRRNGFVEYGGRVPATPNHVLMSRSITAALAQ